MSKDIKEDSKTIDSPFNWKGKPSVIGKDKEILEASRKKATMQTVPTNQQITYSKRSKVKPLII